MEKKVQISITQTDFTEKSPYFKHENEIVCIYKENFTSELN